MATGLLAINHEMFSSKLVDETIFRQCAQSTKCHFDEVTFRRNGSLDEVSFDEVSQSGKRERERETERERQTDRERYIYIYIYIYYNIYNSLQKDPQQNYQQQNNQDGISPIHYHFKTCSPTFLNIWVNRPSKF